MLHGHFNRNGTLWIVVLQGWVFKNEVLDIPSVSDRKLEELPWGSHKRFLQRIDMVSIHMSVAKHIYERSWQEHGHICKHSSQQRTTSNIKLNAKTHIAWAMVHLTRPSTVFYIKLYEEMTRPQRQEMFSTWVPRRHAHATITRVCLQRMEEFCQLVNTCPVVVCLHVHILFTLLTQLKDIDCTKITHGPFFEVTSVQKLLRLIGIPSM